MQARSSFLSSQQTPWIKKGNSTFDVGMGSFDGAETCELVGLFLLSKLQHMNLNIGLYRDDGLGICLLRPQQVENQVKQEIIQIFQNFNLKISIEVDYLDVSFDLESGIFKPFKKENNTPLYVHKSSNHPPSI